MNPIEQKIQEAIEANLPAQVGETLKKRLEQAQNDAEEVESLRRKLSLSRAAEDRLTAEVDGLKKDLLRHAELSEREKTVAARENKLEVVMAQRDKTAAEDKCNALFSLVGTIFKNTVVRENVCESLSRNNYGGNDSTASTKTVTREVE